MMRTANTLVTTSPLTQKMCDYRTFEIRTKPDIENRVEGYAAVFDSETVLYTCRNIQYKEVIDRSAFTGAEMSDVMMNYNHMGKPVARTKNGTLILAVDAKGLHVEADLSGTEEGRRLYEEIKGGYIDKMSFAFSVNKEEYDKAQHLRRITGFRRIFDVAVVDRPAYDATEISARSWWKIAAEQEKLNRRRKLALKLKMEGF